MWPPSIRVPSSEDDAAPISYVRLDDSWQSGAIWRAESRDSPTLAFESVPPLVALGLGWRTCQAPAAEAPPTWALPGGPGTVTWRGVLTPGALDRGELRLSARALELLVGQATVTLRVEHDDAPPDVLTGTLDDAARLIRDLSWPWAFFPGYRVYCSLEPYAAVITVRTRRLLGPVCFGDRDVWFDHDSAIVARDLGVDVHPGGAAAWPRRTSLRELIAATFRSRGPEREDHSRQLRYADLVNAILGPDASYKDAQLLLSTLDEMEIEHQGDLYTWRPRVTAATTVRDDTVLATFEESERPRLQRRNRDRYATWTKVLPEDEREPLLGRLTTTLLSSARERGFVTLHELARAVAWLRRDEHLVGRLAATLDEAGVAATRAVAHTHLRSADPAGVFEYFAPLFQRTPSCRTVLTRLGYSPAVIDSLSTSTQAFCMEAFFKHQFTRQVEEQLLAVIAATQPDTAGPEVVAAKTALFEDNLWLVVQLAGKLLGRGLPLDDLIQEGAVGLMKAIDRYKPGLTARLMNYATIWIMQAMQRAIGDTARCIRLPVHVCELLPHVARTEDELWFALDRAPSAKEISAELDIPPGTVADLLACRAPTLSLESVLVQDPGAQERAAQPRNQILVEQYQRAMLDRVYESFAELSPRQRAVVTVYTGLIDGEPHTYAEIGERLGVTRERVRQIFSKALDILRAPFQPCPSGSAEAPPAGASAANVPAAQASDPASPGTAKDPGAPPPVMPEIVAARVIASMLSESANMLVATGRLADRLTAIERELAQLPMEVAR